MQTLRGVLRSLLTPTLNWSTANIQSDRQHQCLSRDMQFAASQHKQFMFVDGVFVDGVFVDGVFVDGVFRFNFIKASRR